MAVLDLYLDGSIGQRKIAGEEVHPEALKWCSCLRKIVKRICTNEREGRKRSFQIPFLSGRGLNVACFMSELDRLDIVEEQSGEPVSFFGMDYEQKCVFADLMFKEEAFALSDKIRQVPQLASSLAYDNRILAGLLAFYGMALDREDKEWENQLTPQGGFDIFANFPHRPISTVHSTWNGKAKRGDVLLTLPKHGCPWLFANLNPRYTHKMGHLAVMTKDIDESSNKYGRCTVECMLQKGVHERTMKNWDTPHYVLGLQRVRWHWNWKREKSVLRRETIPVEKPSALADIAEKYIGRAYVRWYEVVVCKWAAPERFTCSTLIWWCAKEAYGFSVSNWLYAFATPADILRNPSTYIKAEVK